MLHFVLFFALQTTGAFADATRCEKLKAEGGEIQSMQAVACDESRETHAQYVKSITEVNEICRRLEAQVAAGPTKLNLGTEDEMHSEIVDIKQLHMTDRHNLAERVTRELLPTALDNNDPSRIPPTVSSECGSEIESHVRFRRNVLRGINEFFLKIEEFDDTLFQQAANRALPKPAAAPVKNVR